MKGTELGEVVHQLCFRGQFPLLKLRPCSCCNLLRRNKTLDRTLQKLLQCVFAQCCATPLRVSPYRHISERGSAAPNNERQLGNSALHLAALGAHLDVMKLLLEHNADVNGINDEGNTGLILSTICMADSASDCARLLIESKADPEIQNLPSENGGGGGCRAWLSCGGPASTQVLFYVEVGSNRGWIISCNIFWI